MKTIVRNFKTLKAAERYQNGLYNRFDYVRLVSAPRFTESGLYVWDVK